MLYFVDGKNGSGKSLFAVIRMVLMLEFSRKLIVTNMEELKLPDLNEFLAKRAARRGECPPNLDERLLIIRKEETPQYFRFRSGGLVLPPVKETDEMGKRIKHHEFLEMMRDYFLPVGQAEETKVGVCYFLDEVQDYFGAREWAETGRAVAWHVGKHRHLDDDVYWMTPCSEEVDAQLRRKCHEWFRLMNCYRMKIKGFRMPGGFKAHHFYSEPRPGVEATEVISFKLGDGYENCYETTNALGVRGKPETKPPGYAPPFWMMVAGLCAAVVIGAVALWSLPKVVGHGLGHVMGSLNAGMLHGMAHNNPVPASTPGQLLPSIPATLRDDQVPKRYYCGLMNTGTAIEVCAADSGEWLRVVRVLPGGLKIVVVEDGSMLYPEPPKIEKERVQASVLATIGGGAQRADGDTK